MRLFIIVIVLLAIGFQAPTVFASTSAERADELFLGGKYEKAMTEADKAIDSDSGKKYELYYLKGLSALKLNKFAEARKAFEYVKERYPRSDRALDSYIGIGDAYFLEGNTSGALRSYKAAAEAFEDDKNIMIVRERIAECLNKSEIKEKAKEYTDTRSVESVPVAVGSIKKRKESVNFTPKKKTPVIIEPLAKEESLGLATSQFSVQVGSFKRRSNASNLVSKLSERNYKARLESPSGNQDKLYRVKVGMMSSKEEAERLAVKLKREGYPVRVCQED